MVCEIMTEPFGTKHPPTLLSAAKLLQTILRTCWPRVPHYCNDVVRALMLCWLNVEEEREEGTFPGNGAADLQAELKRAADMLAAVMEAAGADMDERVSPLIKAGPQLGKLFTRADDLEA